MPRALSYIHVTRSTPAPAVALQGFLAFLFLVVGDIMTLIEFASFLIWFFYGSAMVALLVMRKTRANVHRPYKVPIILPVCNEGKTFYQKFQFRFFILDFHFVCGNLFGSHSDCQRA